MDRVLVIIDATSSGFIGSFRWLHFIRSIATDPYAVGYEVKDKDVVGLRLRRPRTEIETLARARPTHTHTHARARARVYMLYMCIYILYINQYNISFWFIIEIITIQ
jgi:hypothetical protein